MRLFLESFGFIIGIAAFAAWGIALSIRYPLPLSGGDDTRTKWLERFCEKYKGAPCQQMKIFIWSCAGGTALFAVLNFFVVNHR
jgi:hypothetical protein